MEPFLPLSEREHQRFKRGERVVYVPANKRRYAK